MSSRRPSLAMVVAVLALTVSLSANAYAVAELAKNSVGAKQLKKDAVRSAKVKDGSLGTADLSAAAQQALRGAAGPAGPPGQQGAPGQPGSPGATGPMGPSDVYASKAGCCPTFGTSDTFIDSLTLPAGSYAVFASVAIQSLALSTETRSGRCTLNRTGGSESFVFDYRTPGNGQASHSAQIAFTATGTTTVTLVCDSNVADGSRLLNAHITAIRTAILHTQ